MACKKNHTETDQIMAQLPVNQGGKARHKCASCSYEKGLENGKNRIVNFDIEGFIASLDTSQEGQRRHKDPLEAYTMGFFHGLSGKNTHEVIKEKYQLSDNMAQFGLMQVGKGIYECTFMEDTPFKYAMSTVHVASGFELIIKARIAQEHPYLIFEKLPKHAKVKNGVIKYDDLLEHGHTINYSELPERLWVTTACQIPEINLFHTFGKVRNQIIHFGTPDEDFAKLVFQYCFKIIEPLVNEWWDITLLEYAWEYDTELMDYIFEQLNQYDLSVNYECGSDIYELNKKS
jgi:hypothetical protein